MIFEQWLSKETEWIKEISKQNNRKMLFKDMPISFLVIEAVMGALGYFYGDISLVMRNLLYGLIFFAFIFLLSMISTYFGSLKKVYLRSLKKEISKSLKTEAEKDTFARDMLDENGKKTEILEWTEDKRPVTLFKGEHFTMLRRVNSANIVNLDVIDRVETDKKYMTYYTKTGNTRVKHENVFYPIIFYYRNINMEPGRKKEIPGAELMFSDREIRDKVLNLIEGDQTNEGN